MSKSVDYYKKPKFLAFLFVPAMGYITLATYVPNKIPFDYLSVVGTATKHLVTNYPNYFKIFVCVIWGIHLLEATYAGYLTRRLKMSTSCTLYWFIQTFLLGFPSTTIIKRYFDSKKTKRNN